MYTLVLYSFPIVTLYYLIKSRISYINEIYTLLRIVKTILFVIEIYLNLYFYGFYKERVSRFIVPFNETRQRLRNVFVGFDANGFNTNALCTVVMFLTSAVALVFRVLILSGAYSLLSLFRHLVVLPITMQWCICMRESEENLSKVMKLLKTAAYPDNSGVDLKLVDKIVREYRTVADQNRLLVEYYNPHNALCVAILVFHTIMNPYLLWYCIVKQKLCVEGCCGTHFLITGLLVMCSFVLIGLFGLISESVNRKVSCICDSNLQMLRYITFLLDFAS